MKLGLVLSIGESFIDLKKHGQDVLVRDQYLKAYSAEFERVYVFSYGNEKYPLFKNNRLIVNSHKIHRFFYSLLMPILHPREFKNCDVLRGYQTTGGIPCVVAKLLYGIPFVVNYGYDYESIAKIEGSFTKAFFYKIINFVVLRNANTVIVTNPVFMKTVKKSGAKNITLIPNSVNTSLFSPKKKKTMNKIKQIVFIGRLEPQKNIISLLKALEDIRYPYHMKIIGTGSQKKYLKKYASTHKINVTFIDSIPHNKLPTYLKSADIFVLPSIIEGNPKVLLEAMSAGVATIGSNAEGIREIISDKKNGILTGIDSQQIRNAIEYLIQSPRIARELGKNSRKYIEENYSSTLLLRKEIKLLKSVV